MIDDASRALSLPEARQAEMLRTLGEIKDMQERLAVAVGWKSTLRELEESERVEGNLVRGCVSRVWLVGEMEEGRCRFRVDGDSSMVRGLARLLCGIYDGAGPGEVVKIEPAALEELGIMRNLSPTRRNGLEAVRRALAAFAGRHQDGGRKPGDF